MEVVHDILWKPVYATTTDFLFQCNEFQMRLCLGWLSLSLHEKDTCDQGTTKCCDEDTHVGVFVLGCLSESTGAVHRVNQVGGCSSIEFGSFPNTNGCRRTWSLGRGIADLLAGRTGY